MGGPDSRCMLVSSYFRSWVCLHIIDCVKSLVSVFIKISSRCRIPGIPDGTNRPMGTQIGSWVLTLPVPLSIQARWLSPPQLQAFCWFARRKWEIPTENEKADFTFMYLIRLFLLKRKKINWNGKNWKINTRRMRRKIKSGKSGTIFLTSLRSLTL